MTSLRAGALALSLALSPALAPAAWAQSASFTPEQLEALDSRIRSYLLENPEVLLEVFDVLEQRRLAAQADSDAALVAMNADRLFFNDASPVLGNTDGDVTVVMFSDYRCGFCKRARPILAELIETDPGVRVVIKELPILGEASVMASRVALAALKQGPAVYEALHDALLSYGGQIDEAVTMRIARRAGVDMEALRRDIENPAIADAIRATYALASDLGVEGTPSFVVGSQIVRGMVPLDSLRDLVAVTREQQG